MSKRYTVVFDFMMNKGFESKEKYIHWHDMRMLVTHNNDLVVKTGHFRFIRSFNEPSC